MYTGVHGRSASVEEMTVDFETHVGQDWSRQVGGSFAGASVSGCISYGTALEV